MLVNGTIGDAAVTSTGEGDIYVVGTTTSVAVDSSGDGDIKLRNANGNAYHITSAEPEIPPPHLLPGLLLPSVGFKIGLSQTERL